MYICNVKLNHFAVHSFENNTTLQLNRLKNILWINKSNVHTCMQYSINQPILFLTTWLDLDDITLSKVSQKQTPYDLTYMWNPEKQKAEWTSS